MRLLLISIFALLSASLIGSNLESYRPGKDYALFFPVSKYTHPALTNLNQSVPNAQLIASYLKESFGFEFEIIPNATYDQIADKLEDYHQKFADGRLPADGQLFIYFSGHGVNEFDNGYFLPADADPDNLPRTALAYNHWRQYISSIKCQHIMVAVDACYSVTFDPDYNTAGFQKFGDDILSGNDDSPTAGSTDPFKMKRKGELSETERILANHKSYKSRTFFTSDAKANKTPGRSDFARKLQEGLLELRGPDGFVSSHQLYAEYVAKAQPPTLAGDFEGDNPSATFLFFHPVNAADVRTSPNGLRGITESTIVDRQGFIYKTINFPNGKSWLAENLKLPSNMDFCYEDMDRNCNKFGRYYTLKAAKKMCPKGWRLPSYKDWEIALRQDSTNALNIGYYGYCQRPKMLDREGATVHSEFGQTAAFWTSDIDNIYNSVLLNRSAKRGGSPISYRMTNHKKYALQCRCIKD